MRRIIVPFLTLACASAVMVGISLLWRPAALCSLPLTWPSFLVLGADETTERFGLYGELILTWVCSLPVALAYATIWALARRAYVSVTRAAECPVRR